MRGEMARHVSDRHAESPVYTYAGTEAARGAEGAPAPLLPA
jgi:hypothetical protein